jgi:hypothetical protein
MLLLLDGFHMQLLLLMLMMMMMIMTGEWDVECRVELSRGERIGIQTANRRP